MKKLIAWFLVLAMCVSMFAACGQDTTPTTAPTEAPTQATEPAEVVDLSDPEGLAAALEYLKTIYKNAGGLTPKDFTRVGTVPIGAKRFEVVWTASVGEDLVKAVRGADGMVTIDINEACDTETPYTLTATLTDEAGNSVSYSWEHTLPAALNVGDILDQAYALGDGESLPYEVTLTGVVTSIDTLWSDQYGNITVTIAMEGHEDRPIQCYRLAGDGAKDIAVGDTITVTGTLSNYKGTIEFAQGCTLDNRISGGGTAPTPVEYTRYQPFPNGQKVVIYNVKYGMALSEKKTSHYNVGVKKSSYGATEVWTAVLHSNGTYSFVNADGEAIGMGSEYSSMDLGEKYDRWEVIKLGRGKFLIRNLKRDEYFMEWYAKYNNFSTYNYHAPETDDQYIMNFILLDDDEVPAPEVPDTTLVPEFVDDPKADVAYKLVIEQNNLEAKIGFTGKMSGYYYETSDNMADAVDVYLEEVTGGYQLYFMNGEVKTYLNVVPRDATRVNVVLQTLEANAAPSVYKLNTEYKYFYTQCVDKEWYLGTYGTYNTISASETYRITGDNAATIGVTQFPAWFATLVEAEVEVELTIAEAIAMGSAMDHNTFTEDKYYVTGEIVEVYQTTYGNMRIKDAEGNILTIYGTYSADGNTRYDALEVKPVAGDTVRLYGIIGQYNGAAQMKDGWIVEHTPAAGGEEGGEEGEMTLEEQLAAAGALANGQYLEQTTSIVGNVSVINDEYSAQYGNITFTVDVNGTSVYCYRVTGDGMDKLKVGDVVKVEGNLTAYNGSAQFDKTAAVKVLSLADQLVDAAALGNGEYLTYKTYIEGKVSVINYEYSAQYGNITFTVDVDGTSVYCYRVTGEGMDKLAVGDTVKVEGKLTAYNGSAQFDKTAVVTVVPAAGGEEGGETGGEEGGETEDTTEGITITFDDKAKRTVFTAEQQVWVENGITVTNDKAASQSDVADHADPARFYKGSNVTVDCEGMTKIAFNCDDYKDSYVTELVASLAAEGYEAAVDGLVVTVAFESAVDSFTVSGLTAQVRVDSITVYGPEGGESGGEEGGESGGEEGGETGGEEGGETGGEVGETTTVTVSIADYAAANGWAIGTGYDTINMDETVKVTATGTPTGDWGLNTGKFYTNGNNWRIYQNENPAITVSAEGKTIVSVKITYTVDKTGVLTLNGENVDSDAVVTVNASSVTFSVGNTATATNGQVRITAIEVVYG